jgi:hypothetical protein
MTTLLGSLQTAKLASALVKLHWNSTTTETEEDVFISSPAASHTFVKFLILTGMLGVDSPEGTMARAMSPCSENSVVFPRSSIVMSGHNESYDSTMDVDCTFEKQASSSHTTKD